MTSTKQDAARSDCENRGGAIVIEPRQRKQPILAIDPAGRVAKANEAALRALSKGADDVERSTIGSLILDLLRRPGKAGGQTNVSFLNSKGEPEDILVVLTEAEGAKKPPPEGNARPHDPGSEDNPEVDFMAHELRNPLQAILGLSQIVTRRFATLSQQDRTIALETIQAEAENALLIIQGLLRLAEGRKNTHPTLSDVPLHSVIQRLAEAHRRRCPTREIRLEGDAPVFARGDSLWIELAVANLLSNAEKYSPPDRPIEIALRQLGSRVVVLVLDNGDGLPTERYARLWDLYERGPDSKAVVTGSGIGLALCKRLVAEMGGNVWAGPRAGGGSAFSVSLPSPWEGDIPAALNTRLSDVRAAASA